MPISGLVIHFANFEEAESLAQSLQTKEPRLEFGERQTDRWPCVLETGTAKESESVHEWLLKQPGILGVEVVFVSVEGPEQTGKMEKGFHSLEIINPEQ